MAVLSRDEYFNRIQDIVGTDTSDATLSFIEDMTDTYTDLENRANGDGEDWKQKYEELDASWRERYKHSFFNGGVERKVTTIIEEEEVTPETIKPDDLFE